MFLLLSRLGPYFAVGEGQKGWAERTAGSYMPHLDLVDRFSIEATERLAAQLADFFAGQCQLNQLHRAELEQPWEPQHEIYTNLSDSPYTVFDALFHWMD